MSRAWDVETFNFLYLIWDFHEQGPKQLSASRLKATSSKMLPFT